MIKRNPEIIEIVIDLRPKGTLFSGAAVVSQPPGSMLDPSGHHAKRLPGPSGFAGSNLLFTKTEQSFFGKAVGGRISRSCERGRCYMEDGFNLTQLVEVCGPTELILVRPGEFLFREGDEAQSLYVVKKGSLRIMSGCVVYETITAGGVVGEMALIR